MRELIIFFNHISDFINMLTNLGLNDFYIKIYIIYYPNLVISLFLLI